MEPRRLLLQFYQQALQRVDGRRCVAAALERHTFEQPPRILALGKAAPAMLRGALDVLDDAFDAALLVTRHGYLQGGLPQRVTCIEAGHPLPDADSLRAGEAIWDFVDETEGPLLLLLSGGASALAERLPEGLGLAELQRVNDWLLASGLAIASMNRIRKSLSTLKGGRLAQRLRGEALCLMISDVPGDRPSVIGSGPLVADDDDTPLPENLPDWLSAMLEQAPAAPLADDPCFQRVDARIIAANGDALAAVSTAAREAGLTVYGHEESFQGAAAVLGEAFARELMDGPPGLYLWGGESTVTLPPEPGRGGRRGGPEYRAGWLQRSDPGSDRHRQNRDHKGCACNFAP